MKHNKLFLTLLLGCFLSIFILTKTEAQVITGNVLLQNQAQVNAFVGTSIVGNLTIAGSTISGNDITDLTPLNNLTSISGVLSFYYNSNLTEISGMNNLTFVGSSLNITGCASLTSVSGLNGLTSFQQLDINNNPLLESIDGFSNLTSLDVSLLIYSNASLVSLNGLSNLTTLNGPQGDLYIVSNASLTNLDGLSSLSTIGDHAIIIANSSLENLDGLSSLTSIGTYLRIDGNPSLANLNGLSSLTSVGTYLQIQNNINLSNFCGLFPLLNANGLAGSYTVSGNAIDPIQQDIINGGFCYVQDIEDLVTAVDNLNNIGTLNNGQANSLTAKLVGLKNLIDKGNKNAAINKLNAFINHVEGFVNGSVLTSAEAQPLINAANSIISQINSLPKHVNDDSNSSVPQDFTLENNFPNPFNPSTVIQYAIPIASNVKLEVFNITGEKVATLVDGFKNEGTYKESFNAASLPSGMYLYRINAGSFVETKKMILMK